MKVIPEARVSKLAADMILVAYRDLKTPETSLEAALWFMGKDFPFWAEIANIPYADPLNMFRKLGRRHARSLLSQLANRSDLPDGYTVEEYRSARKILVPILSDIANRGRIVKQAAEKVQHGTYGRTNTK